MAESEGMPAPKTTYFHDSARPLTALVFVLPMLLVYEIGILSLGPSAMRNGAEQWLRKLLDTVGFGQYLLLPLLTCLVLLGWHHITRGDWRVSQKTLYQMVSETVMVACGLVALAFLQSWLWSSLGGQSPQPPAAMAVQGTGRIVGFFGAGIYEELLFRLMLIPTIAQALIWLGENPRSSLWSAAVVSSLAFAAAHYRMFVEQGDLFRWDTFAFRFIAGMIFATLFIYRGFGIAAASHTLYDVLVGTAAN